MDKQLQEKIKLSEKLVDQYLNELNITAAGVQAAQGLGRDAVRMAQWVKKKIDDKKKARMLKKQERMKQRQLATTQKDSKNNTA